MSSESTAAFDVVNTLCRLEHKTCYCFFPLSCLILITSNFISNNLPCPDSLIDLILNNNSSPGVDVPVSQCVVLSYI